MSEVMKEVYCLGVQRAATTSIYDDIANAMRLPPNEIKEKASLFKGDSIPEGTYLTSHSGYKKGNIFLDFTPEYCIHLNKIRIPESAFVFLILRKPSNRIISHWKKYCNEIKNIGLQEFIEKNVDSCMDRSRYSKFIPLLLNGNCQYYFLESDLKQLYSDLSRYLGCDIKQSIKSNSSIRIPNLLLPLYRYLAIGKPNLHRFLMLIGVKRIYRMVIRPFFIDQKKDKISASTVELLESINLSEKSALEQLGLHAPW